MKSFKSVTFTVLALLFALAGTAVQAADPADMLFTNGKVYTVNEQQPWAEAVAIKGNKIVYVGDSAGAQELKGESTEVVDLAGKMVLPGFVSGHEHLIAGAWMGYGVKLFEARSKDEYLQLIKEYADQHPDEKFILGGGWNADVYGSTPTAEELDTVTGDRPAIILDFTVHDAWLNTKALQLGGIDKNAESPVDDLIKHASEFRDKYKSDHDGWQVHLQSRSAT